MSHRDCDNCDDELEEAIKSIEEQMDERDYEFIDVEKYLK